MSTKALVPIEEYLRMRFEGSGPEYLGGQLVERSVGEDKHSSIRAILELREFCLTIQRSDVFE